jgi:hypothetical protein
MSDMRFDWYASLDESWLNDLVRLVQETIDQDRSTRGLTPGQKQDRALQEALISQKVLSALYQAYCFIFPRKSTQISFPLDKSCFTMKENHPGKIALSATYTRNVYEALLSLGWITVQKGSEYGGYTRIFPEGNLKATFDEKGLRWVKQQPRDKSSLVVLRDKDAEGKKFDLETPETPEVNTFRDNLYQYNDFLTRHCIALDVNDSQLAQVVAAMASKEEQQRLIYWNEDTPKIAHINFSRVQLRRIFSRGSMELGGRFYNCWWQQIPSAYRPHITIDGKPTIEIDFSGMCLRILYASQGVEYPVDKDPYDIGLNDWKGDKDPRRKFIKTFINAYINDENETFRLKSQILNELRLSHHELVYRVKKCHKAINSSFGSLDGLKTMYADSMVAERIMLEGMKQDIVILPIHDSFLIRAAFASGLKQLMESTFQDILQVSTKTTSTPYRFQNTFGWSEEKVINASKDPRNGVVNAADLKESYFKYRGLMSGYVSSFTYQNERMI